MKGLHLEQLELSYSGCVTFCSRGHSGYFDRDDCQRSAWSCRTPTSGCVTSRFSTCHYILWCYLYHRSNGVRLFGCPRSLGRVDKLVTMALGDHEWRRGALVGNTLGGRATKRDPSFVDCWGRTCIDDPNGRVEHETWEPSRRNFGIYPRPESIKTVHAVRLNHVFLREPH